MTRMTLVGIVAGTLMGAPALAQTQSAEEAIKQGAQQAEQGSQEAVEATKQEAEKATKDIDRAAQEGKQEIDQEAAAAKQEVEKSSKTEEQLEAAEDQADQMEEALEDKLEKDSELKTSDIDVEATNQGAVTLTGTVPNEDAHQRALELTTATKGVNEVQDMLQVENPGQQAPVK